MGFLNLCLLRIFALNLMCCSYGFITPRIARKVRYDSMKKDFHQMSGAGHLQLVTDSSSLFLSAETESWRQYVPLVVSGLVIVDVALGSPAANAVLGKVRPKAEGGQEASASGTPEVNPNERIDSQAIAQAALDKASSTLELKKFLEESKSDWDKMEDIKKKMDQELEDFDKKNRSSK